MNLKQKIKTQSFWVGLSSALLLLCQALLKPLNIEISEEQYLSIINAFLGVFVFLGIINKDSQNDNKNDQQNI